MNKVQVNTRLSCSEKTPRAFSELYFSNVMNGDFLTQHAELLVCSKQVVLSNQKERNVHLLAFLKRIGSATTRRIQIGRKMILQGPRVCARGARVESRNGLALHMRCIILGPLPSIRKQLVYNFLGTHGSANQDPNCSYHT